MSHVLNKFTAAQLEIVQNISCRIAKLVDVILFDKAENFYNNFNKNYNLE